MNFAKNLPFILASGMILSACQNSPTNRPLITPPQVTDTATAPSEAFSPTEPTTTGNLENSELAEVSGMAASARYPDILWAINDSGNAATLYAFNQAGESLGTFSIAENNRDWEDLAAASINGEPYLLIGDIGDNLRVKAEHAIHVLAEPLLNEPPVDELQPIHTLYFRYPDESHNAESLAFADGYVYVLTKEPLNNGDRQSSKAFRIPLNFSDSDQLHVAEEIASLAIPSNSIEASLIASVSGVDISQPTAFEIDPQNRHAYMLTYRSVYRYTREQNQSWGEVLSEPRVRAHSHSLSQAEALAVTKNGVVWFTSEKRPAPLWALPAQNY